MLRWSQRCARVFGAGLLARDWRLQTRGRPQFFKHRVNLAYWPTEPGRWSFTARGVYARQDMFRGCRVLDLCCGDGSFSYLFFSDIAGTIDAVDNNADALAYARRNSAAPGITFHRIDIVNEPLPGADYDFIIWNAAICYFAPQEIRRVLAKISAAGKPAMQLYGMLPRANGWIDHKTEFADRDALERLLAEFFATVRTREIDEGSAITFYFQASMPRRTAA